MSQLSSSLPSSTIPPSLPERDSFLSDLTLFPYADVFVSDTGEITKIHRRTLYFHKRGRTCSTTCVDLRPLTVFELPRSTNAYLTWEERTAPISDDRSPKFHQLSQKLVHYLTDYTEAILPRAQGPSHLPLDSLYADTRQTTITSEICHCSGHRHIISVLGYTDAKSALRAGSAVSGSQLTSPILFDSALTPLSGRRAGFQRCVERDAAGEPTDRAIFRLAYTRPDSLTSEMLPGQSLGNIPSWYGRARATITAPLPSHTTCSEWIGTATRGCEDPAIGSNATYDFDSQSSLQAATNGIKGESDLDMDKLFQYIDEEFAPGKNQDMWSQSYGQTSYGGQLIPPPPPTAQYRATPNTHLPTSGFLPFNSENHGGNCTVRGDLNEASQHACKTEYI
ncbi:hypothetical protein IAT40_007063 [Kwoniella sp. CBS 6097]